MRGHLRAKRGHLLRKLIAVLLCQSRHPFRQYVPRRVIQEPDLFAGQPLCPDQRRELCPQKDLVGIRVSDPADDPWIGQGSFHGVVPFGQRVSKAGAVDFQWLDSPRVVLE
ncbi:MAG: hypothetical protein JRJ64_11825 [Deltaproteobacteria bacterium]|nr:hypothetical protein [Deltaproteobacteria bacterium]